MLVKTTAENPGNEHSIKPTNDIISKALESCGFFFKEGEIWKEKPVQVAYQETDDLFKKWTKSVPSTQARFLIVAHWALLCRLLQLLSAEPNKQGWLIDMKWHSALGAHLLFSL